MRQTLRRGQRLSGSRDFRETMDRGRISRGKHFVLFWYLSGTDEPPRVGFFAGRRLGGAVARNRAKRRLREVFRRLRGEIAVGGARLVFQARREAGTSPLPAIAEEMSHTFRRLGLTAGREVTDRDCRTQGGEGQ